MHEKINPDPRFKLPRYSPKFSNQIILKTSDYVLSKLTPFDVHRLISPPDDNPVRMKIYNFLLRHPKIITEF